MAMAYQSGLLGDFYRRKAQQRALTGLPTSYQEERGFADPLLAYDTQKAQQAGLLANQQSQFDRQMALQEKARKDQQVAGMVGGVGQLAMLPLAYSSGKNLGWWGGGANPATTAGTNATTAATAPAGGLLNTAQGAVAPEIVGTTAQGGALTGGSAAFTGATGTAGYGVAEGAGTAGVLGAEGGGLLGAASMYAPPAAAGLIGGNIGSRLALKYSPIGGQREKKIGGGIAGGAAAGAAIGSVIPGAGTAIGAVVGGLIGGIASLF